MGVRKIIKIEEEKCNGCGLCVPNCAEGAIQIIDGKARLVKDSFCDGLGACLGHCPQDALHIIERDADEFDEEAAMNHVKAAKEANNKLQHSNECQGHHHQEHNHHGNHHHGGGCPGSRMRMINQEDSNASNAAAINSGDIEIKIKPQLRQWPVQLHLVPITAPFFQNADLLVTADCVPFAYANYHLELLKGKAVVVGCPKLDDIEAYVEKLSEIVAKNNLKSVTVAFMEVPCCSGIVRAVDIAVQRSGKNIPVTKVRVTIDGKAEYK